MIVIEQVSIDHAFIYLLNDKLVILDISTIVGNIAR